ncbi:MAG: DMT family transporter [Desulfobacterota bacterium]|nr:DMT family transporter [Thermodesulfobacteriota bacterium]
MKKEELYGYLYVLIGSTLWGISSVVAKALFNVGLPPEELVFVRLVLSTLILFFVLLLYDPKRLIIDLKDLPYFLVLGGIGVTGMQFFYYFTISQIQVGPAILLQYLQPLWVFLYAAFFQREPFSKTKSAALVLAVAGCYLMVGGYEIDLLRLNRTGILSGLIASFFFTFYALYGEKGLKKYDPWTLIFYGFGLSALCYLVFVSPVKILGEGHSLKVWIAFLYISIFSTLIPFGFYFKGMERLRATRASITSTWEPVVAGVAAFLALGEVLEPLQIVGGLGVIAAIVLLQLSREKATASSAFEIRRQSGHGV